MLELPEKPRDTCPTATSTHKQAEDGEQEQWDA